MKPFLYFMGFVVFLFFVLFTPFDWWQKPPSKQPDKIIGKILPFLHISLRNIVLRSLFLVFIFIMYLYSIIWIPIISALVLVAMIVRSFWMRLRGRTTEPVIGFVIILLVMCLFAVGIIAPLRLVPIAGYLALGKPAGNLWESLTIGRQWATMDSVIGLCGIFGVASWLFIDAVWRTRQARQVENLATSRIGSLAIGLVEVRGTVRPLTGSREGAAVEFTSSMQDYIKPTQRIERFILEDRTGSVLVDATECRVRGGWISEVAAIFGVREIVLTRRIERDDFTDAVRKTLLYGDRIYVIGNAERNSPGSLMIRPSSRPAWSEVIWKTIFGALKPPKGKDIHDVFFITDGDEKAAKRHIIKGLRTVLSWGLVWIISSVALILLAQQQWRQAPPPDSWRAEYWRGPEPNPSSMIIDYTRNERLFRFEKYIKSVGPASYDQIPALIEAMAYKDYRFYEPATSALLKMKPRAINHAGEAVPILIEHLHPCSYNAKSLQTTIIALASFGPDAAPAVSALIEQFACEKTDTYEVTPDIIKFQAARTLGTIGPAAREAVPVLQRALNDKSGIVREAARHALRRIEQTSAAGKKKEEQLPGWISMPQR